MYIIKISYNYKPNLLPYAKSIRNCCKNMKLPQRYI